MGNSSHFLNLSVLYFFLCSSAIGSGLFSMVVRYNVRGTGQSGGIKSFSAASDATDALEICKCVQLKAFGRVEGGIALCPF